MPHPPTKEYMHPYIIYMYTDKYDKYVKYKPSGVKMAGSETILLNLISKLFMIPLRLMFPLNASSTVVFPLEK